MQHPFSTTKSLLFCLLFFSPIALFADEVPCTPESDDYLCIAIRKGHEWRESFDTVDRSEFQYLDNGFSVAIAAQDVEDHMNYYFTFLVFENLTRLDPNFFYSDGYISLKRSLMLQLGNNLKLTGDPVRYYAYMQYIFERIEPVSKLQNFANTSSTFYWTPWPEPDVGLLTFSECFVLNDQPHLSSQFIADSTKFKSCIGE